MYFIVWNDYDQTKVIRYEDKSIAEEQLARLKALENADEYGTRIHAVIEGEELKYKTIEVVSKCVIED